MDFLIITNATLYLNKLHIQFQRKDKHASVMLSTINAFKTNFDLLKYSFKVKSLSTILRQQ